jgi:hypothetical protein
MIVVSSDEYGIVFFIIGDGSASRRKLVAFLFYPHLHSGNSGVER